MKCSVCEQEAIQPDYSEAKYCGDCWAARADIIQEGDGFEFEDILSTQGGEFFTITHWDFDQDGDGEADEDVKAGSQEESGSSSRKTSGEAGEIAELAEILKSGGLRGEVGEVWLGRDGTGVRASLYLHMAFDWDVPIRISFPNGVQVQERLLDYIVSRVATELINHESWDLDVSFIQNDDGIHFESPDFRDPLDE